MGNPKIAEEGRRWRLDDARRRRALLVEPAPISGARWIPLADGRFTLVDAHLYAELSKLNWRGGGSRGRYASTIVAGRTTYLHAMILGASADHRNGDTLDNRLQNLRPATQRQQCLNVKSRARKVPFKGIYKKSRNTWGASIRIDGKRVHLGSFASSEDAARAYDEAARREHGEFACVNFPRPGERGALHG